MKIRALVTEGRFVKGTEYDMPDNEAQAAIMAGKAEPSMTNAPQNEREKAIKAQHQTRWRTR